MDLRTLSSKGIFLIKNNIAAIQKKMCAVELLDNDHLYARRRQ